jgi:PAS domain S-box-containing protein
MHRVADWCAARPPGAITGIAAIAALLLGAVDWATGNEISFAIFYLAPVSFAAWFGGRRGALAISLLAACIWYAADALAGAHYSSRVIPIWNAAVRLGFFALMTLALTALRRALAGTEERFRQLVEGVRDYAILELDRDGLITSWNAGAERLTGWRAEEMLGQHFSRLYPPDESSRAMRGLKLAASEGRFDNEGWRMRKDGSRFWGDAITTPLRDGVGALRGFSKIVRDTTERRLAEEALRESEERFRMLLDALPDTALAMIDAKGRIASWNAAAERIFGWRADEVIGAHVSRLYEEGENERGRCEEELRSVRSGERFEARVLRRRKDGTPFLARVVMTCLRDDAGRGRGCALLVREEAPGPLAAPEGAAEGSFAAARDRTERA